MHSSVDNITRDFTWSEFECPCGCGFCDPEPLLVFELQRLRDHVHKPVVIHSGCRCKLYNQRIGGRPQSQHLLGYAADIHIAGIAPEAIALIAVKFESFRRGGIGVYENFIHLDIRRQGPARWGKRWRG